MLANKTRVSSEVIPRMLRTLLLAVIAMAISVVLAFWIGVSTADEAGEPSISCHRSSP